MRDFPPINIRINIDAHVSDLWITDGHAEQANSVSGGDVVRSLWPSAVTHRVNRKHVLLGLVALTLASGIRVVLAHIPGAVLMGRAPIGVAISAFRSMSAAIDKHRVSARAGDLRWR